MDDSAFSGVVKASLQTAKPGKNFNVLQFVTRPISRYKARESHTQLSQTLDLRGEKILS